jgi:hypothetical protein
MATAKPIASPSSARPARRGGLRRLGLMVMVAAVGVLAWYWRPLNAYAVTGAAYGARIGCSCRFVAERALGDCRGDLRPGTRFVMLFDDDEAKSVTARFPLLASQTATFREGEGCVLEQWPD